MTSTDDQARAHGASAHLRQLMDDVARAGSLTAVYESSLACLRNALQVERAAVLVLDDHQVMRFVAWTGLSDRYRRAVEGHTPWSLGETDIRPMLVPDVRRDDSLSPYRAVLDGEGIAALAFIPLRFGHKLLGKFMLYHGEPHVFTPEECTVAELVAGHIAFALEHHRMERDLEHRLVSERRAREHAEQEALMREAAETRARESERRLLLALTAGRMGTWEWDIATGAIDWSEHVEAMHGLEPGVFPGTFESFQRGIHPDDRERVLAAIAHTLDGRREEYVVEYRVIMPDREERWITARGRVVRGKDGKPTTMLGVCSDITERKRMEHANQLLSDAGRILATSLEHSVTLKSLSRLAVPSLADWCAIHVVNEAGELEAVEVAHADPAKVELARKVIERWPVRRDMTAAAPLAIRTGEPRVLQRIAREDLVRFAHDDEHLRFLEALRPCSLMSIPLKARGQILGAVTLMTAESQREYGPDDVALAQELAGRAALAIDNARLLSEAQAAIRARDELLALVSHDLKNPLSTIVTATEILELDLPAERRARSRAAIRSAASQMNRLLEDLLDVARIDEGQLSLELNTVDVASVMSEVASVFLPIAEDRSIRLHRPPEPEDSPGGSPGGLPAGLPGDLIVRADRDRLVQMLSNLVSNALKFTPAGGQIHIRGARDKDLVRIAVLDTGPGIPDDHLPRLFDRFWQGDRGSHGGVGLGLAIVKGIAEAHGGRVEVESEVGRGAEFTILLPALTPRAAAARSRDPAQRLVLVADDDDALRQEIVEVLSSQGYRVAEATHGAEALAFLRRHEAPDLMLLDLMMPVMDGWDLLAAIRSDPRLRSTPVIIMSCMDRQRVGSPLERIAGYLKKPFKARQLLELTAQWAAGS